MTDRVLIEDLGSGDVLVVSSAGDAPAKLRSQFLLANGDDVRVVVEGYSGATAVLVETGWSSIALKPVAANRWSIDFPYFNTNNDPKVPATLTVDVTRAGKTAKQVFPIKVIHDS